jgi:hypothetical protein
MRRMRKDFGYSGIPLIGHHSMPHYYFNLTDGVTRRDHRGLDCIDDAEAIERATRIAKEVLAAGGDNSRPNLHISIVIDGREVSRVPIPFDAC